MARAIEIGHLTLENDLTLKEVLQASVAVQTNNRKPAWSFIIDNVTKTTSSIIGDKVRLGTNSYTLFSKSHNNSTRFRLSSVMELTSFLLTTNELPYVRGYLLDSLYKKVEQIKECVVRKSPSVNKIQYNHIVVGKALSFWAFNRFHMGLSNEDVDIYYKKHAKTQGHLDKETGIVTKLDKASFSQNSM